MKKKLPLIGAIMINLLAMTCFSTKVSAETSDSRETEATFELVAPTDALKIAEATDLSFSDAVISATGAVTTTSEEAKVSIEELSGNAPGWQLSAKLGNFVGSTNKKTLMGAKVFYPSINPETTNAGDSSTIVPTSVSTDAAFQGSEKGAILTAGADATPIVIADAGKGYGGWTMTYPKGSIQLEVPAGNLKDTYTATLTYTLVDSPK